MLVETKRDEYREYINNHIQNVHTAYNKLRNIDTYLISSFDNISLTTLNNLLKRILSHDLSKFSDEEFEPYRMHWHPAYSDEKEKSEDAYNKAWEHHYTVNDHHPEHWVNKDTGEPEEMSIDAILEMICDWIGMSIGKGGNTIDWYKSEKDNIPLHPNTRKIVESILDIIDNSII